MRRKLATLGLEEDMVKKSLWVLATLLIGAAVACTLDNPQAPELEGPSTLGRSIELRANPDRLTSDGWSNAVIEAVLRGPNSERISGANIYFDIRGFVDRGNLAPLNGPRPIDGGTEALAVEATTDGEGVARARYWAPFRTDQPNDTVVTILAREVGVNAREATFADTDIFLRAADRPYPGPIPIPGVGCDPPTANVTLSGLCTSDDIPVNRQIFASGAESEAGEAGTIITTYIFDWGDGSEPTTTGSSSTAHTYTSANTNVTITLTVVNSCGASAAASESFPVVGVCPP
jgi:hypothetical protein